MLVKNRANLSQQLNVLVLIHVLIRDALQNQVNKYKVSFSITIPNHNRKIERINFYFLFWNIGINKFTSIGYFVFLLWKLEHQDEEINW